MNRTFEEWVGFTYRDPDMSDMYEDWFEDRNELRHEIERLQTQLEQHGIAYFPKRDE